MQRHFEEEARKEWLVRRKKIAPPITAFLALSILSAFACYRTFFSQRVLRVKQGTVCIDFFLFRIYTPIMATITVQAVCFYIFLYLRLLSTGQPSSGLFDTFLEVHNRIGSDTITIRAYGNVAKAHHLFRRMNC